MADCGYTPAEIREMTLQDVDRLYKHYQKLPPLRVLVALCAAALGVKLPEPPDPNKKYMTPEEAKLLMARTGGKATLG